MMIMHNEFGIVSELDGHSRNNRMDHLACFSSGMLALGAYTRVDTAPKPDTTQTLVAAAGIARTCVEVRFLALFLFLFLF